MKQILNQSDETEVAISEPKNEFTAGINSNYSGLRFWLYASLCTNLLRFMNMKI